ncbi:Uncharacterised protein [Pandoraea pulmonicola]|uniref:Uncharacterized protein n=1 Tax=Pandoraea pulmonicola TaxID=93221 RepID=A0AAJ4ZGZ8_PANPU|nr:Uncharacterised protein [Pandoraea pulmonicola]
MFLRDRLRKRHLELLKRLIAADMSQIIDPCAGSFDRQ